MVGAEGLVSTGAIIVGFGVAVFKIVNGVSVRYPRAEKSYTDPI